MLVAIVAFGEVFITFSLATPPSISGNMPSNFRMPIALDEAILIKLGAHYILVAVWTGKDPRSSIVTLPEKLRAKFPKHQLEISMQDWLSSHAKRRIGGGYGLISTGDFHFTRLVLEYAICCSG